MKVVNLGQTGIRASRLAFGTGSNGWQGRSNQTDLGLKELADLFVFAHDEHGVNFWDSADMYGSHKHLKNALKSIDRDSVVIATKTVSRTPKKIESDVKRFLREIGTDRIDILLLHCLMNADWPQRFADSMEAMSRLKDQGIIRAHGVSCHDFGAFQTAAITDWVDVVLARINYAGVNMDANPSDVVPVIDQMARSGKGVYGMKVLGMGKLAREDGGPKKAIEFVMGLDSVHAMTIGMESREEIIENVSIINEIDSQN